jgi:hypothetical protein
MRIALVSALSLCLGLASNCAAQSNSIVSLAIPAHNQTSIDALKNSSLFIKPIVSAQPWKNVKAPEFFFTPSDKTLANDSCGHLLVYEAPSDTDSAMILQIPKDIPSNMPVIPALPVCESDLRKSPSDSHLLSPSTIPRLGQSSTNSVSPLPKSKP